MNVQDFIPRKTEAYLAAEPLFYANFNDVHFFVEDANCESLYHEIFRNFFPELKVEKVFPLDGKGAVIKHAEQSHRRTKTHVYVVDLDFDLLLGRLNKLDGLFYLDRFCIENHLLEESAFVSALKVLGPKIKIAKIRESLAFEQRLTDYVINFQELYTLFLIIQKHSLPIPNVGDRFHAYLGNHSQLEPDKRKVAKLRHEVCRQLKKSVDSFQTYYDSHERLLVPNPDNYCGKRILDALLNECKTSIPLRNTLPRDAFSVLLAQQCSFDSLKPLMAKITAYIQNRQKGSV